MRVIVDTNVLVSGLISSRGSPARIVDAVLAGRIIPVMSEATFDELEDVLHRPGIRGPAADFIVTGDKDFTESRYGDVPVISAREFVDKVLRR